MLLIVALGLPAMAETALTPYTARYDIKISVLGGELEASLRRTATGFEATQVIHATGLSSLLASGELRETSQFDTVPNGVMPRVYRSQDPLTKERIDATIRFDWETGEARGIVNG